MKQVSIYTDGACTNNPGPGGYGAILFYKDTEKEISGGYILTTNNRMELLAVIKSLEMLKEKCTVRVYSDSKYVVDGIEKGWAKKWRKNNWMRSKSDKAINPDLWEKLLDLVEFHSVKFVWVKGHTDNKHNERCDLLARQAILNKNLLSDANYK